VSFFSAIEPPVPELAHDRNRAIMSCRQIDIEAEALDSIVTTVRKVTCGQLALKVFPSGRFLSHTSLSSVLAPGASA
jgi:hypothetical protein